MTHYAVMDVETTLIKEGEAPRTLFWGYADYDGYRKFHTTAEFLDFLRAISDDRIIFHHYNFDIIQLVMDGCRDITFVKSHNGRFILSKLGERITMLNSASMFPCSLEEIFKCFGYKKHSLDDLDARNYSDCVDALNCFIMLDELFYDLLDVSPFDKKTLAGTTFGAAELVAGKLPKDLRFPECYKGGRVDVFDTNFHFANRFDVNSSYPFSFLDAPSRGELLYCEIKTNDFYGPLFDSGVTDRLMFPFGKFFSYVYRDVLDRYILPSCSDASLSIRIIEKWEIDLSWLGRCKPVIMKLYNLKKNNPKTSAKHLIGKLGVNSIYGRVGLRGESERVELLPYIPDKPNLTAIQLDDESYICWYNQHAEARSNFPVAGYITDNARGRLYSAITKSSALYCDTDSIDTLSTIETSNTLGAWKHEGLLPFKAANLKDYRRGPIHPFTGLESDAIREERFGERHVKGGESQIQWTFKQMIVNGEARRIDKTFSGVLRKRERGADGITNPIRVGK